jgi:hypothetical protein
MSPEFSRNPANIDSQAFIAEHGIEEIAELQVEAHGNIYSVREAIMECPPFAAMIKGLANSLGDLPNRSDIIANSIKSMAPTAEIPESAKKKLM